MSPPIRASTLCAPRWFASRSRAIQQDYLDPEKRSIANAVQVWFKDGSKTERVAVEYPIGHRRRRTEGMPLLLKKFETNLASRFAPAQCENIMRLCADPEKLDAMPVDRVYGFICARQLASAARPRQSIALTHLRYYMSPRQTLKKLLQRDKLLSRPAASTAFRRGLSRKPAMKRHISAAARSPAAWASRTLAW